METLPINGFDIAVIIFVLISAVLALFRGFLREFLSVIGWVGAVFVMLYGAPILMPLIQPYITNDTVNMIVCYVFVFLFSLIVFLIFSHFLAKLVHGGTSLGPIDRTIGFIFGIVRGVIVVALIYLVLVWVWPEDKHPIWIKDAKTIPYIASTANWIKTLVPGIEDQLIKKDMKLKPIQLDLIKSKATEKENQNVGANYSKEESLDQLFN